MQSPFGNGDNNGMIPLPSNYATMKDPESGNVKIGKVGFSFTTLFLSIFIPILRSDWYNLLCMLGIDAIVLYGSSIIFNQPVDVLFQPVELITSIFWGFCYNLMYFRHLHHIGYVPGDKHSKDLLIKNKYIKDHQNNNQDNNQE